MRHNLIKARTASELSQEALGKMAGITKQAICQLESGRMDARRATWVKLAKILNSTIEHLSLDDSASQ